MAKMTLDELVAQLRSALGNGLQCVVLYGSAAGGEHIAKRSDYNVLVIVDELPAERLQAASAVSAAWSETGNPAPLILTAEEWRSSADIFAMEYADILERHRVLYGAPPFDGIRVDSRDLRLQLEHEAMGKLLKLRRGVLSAGNSADKQIELLDASVSTIMVLFRAFLRLHGERPPADNVALSAAVGIRAGFNTDAFAKVVRHARGEAKISSSDVGPVLHDYVRGVDRVARYLDQWTAPQI